MLPLGVLMGRVWEMGRAQRPKWKARWTWENLLVVAHTGRNCRSEVRYKMVCLKGYSRPSLAVSLGDL